MSDINWDLAPEGATEIVAWGNNLRWGNETKVYSLSGESWIERDSGWQAIATRPQPERKTVEDAYEYSGGFWGNDHFNVLAYNHKTQEWNYCNVSKNDEQFVCNRGQFESYAKEQEDKPHFKATRENLEKIAEGAKGDFVEVDEPEWTHVTNSGFNCRVIVDKPDAAGVVIVLAANGQYMRHSESLLKPITPTITESEQQKCIELAEHFDIAPPALHAYLSKYEVVK